MALTRNEILAHLEARMEEVNRLINKLEEEIEYLEEGGDDRFLLKAKKDQLDLVEEEFAFLIGLHAEAEG